MSADSYKILLENRLRHEDGHTVTAGHIKSLVDGFRGVVAFSPSRVFLHDTNGVPVLTDPAAVRPHIPSHLTVDHSIATEVSGRPDALRRNVEIEYERTAERFRFLKWGERLDGVHIVPPGTGIMHRINLEYLAWVVERRDGWASRTPAPAPTRTPRWSTRWYTGGDAAIIAYHGSSKWMADLSSNEWPPGYRPPHVGTFTVPRDSVVTPAFSAEGLRPALVLADSQFTSEGIFDVPAGFLAGLVESAHAAGAMYVADEVQPGYGRSCGGSPWPGSRRTW